MLQIPALFFAVLFASTCSVAFYLLKGRGLRDLLIFWVAAVLGFAAGQILGERLDLIPWTIGQVRLVEGTIMAILFLIMTVWLQQKGKST
jgi:uncharacterized membrane protein YjjP (DUF1212 family)